MKRSASIALGAVFAAGVLLAGCGGGGHAVCKDAASTQEYSRKFTTDMIAAAGRLSPDVMTKMQTEFQGISAGSGADFAGFCVKLDDIRKKYGI